MVHFARSSGLVLGLFVLASGCTDDGGGDGNDGATESSDSSEDSGESGESETGESESDTGGPDPIFLAGFDVTDLTPTDDEIAGDFFLGGYGLLTERGAADGVHDPIYVRSMAIAVDDGSGSNDAAAVFAIVDTVGFGNQWTRAIRADAAEATGLSPEQIVIGATHTHSGPDFQGLWGGVPDVYRERVIETIVASMASAWDARVAADVEVASTTADNRNRRDWGFTDDALLALRATDSGSEELLGTMVVFAAHPVVLGSENLLVSRDFCGYAVDDLEAESGAPVLFFNGAQGDVSPDVPDPEGGGAWADDFERAEAYGGHIAARAVAILADAEPVEPALHRDYGSFDLDVTNELFIFAAQSGILDYDFELRGNSGTVNTQTAYFRLGANQVQMVAFPGESLTRNGLAVKDAMSAPHQAILGLSGDSLGYFVPSDEWMTGLNEDYEESVSVGEAAGDFTRDQLIGLIDGDPWPN